MKLLLLLCVCLCHNAFSQEVYLDTIVYTGNFKLNGNELRYKRIKQTGENISNKNIIVKDKYDQETEYLEILNAKNTTLLNVLIAETEADCNSASLTKSKCQITDTSIIITKYLFWTGLCYNCEIGLTIDCYKLNKENKLVVQRLLDKACLNTEKKKVIPKKYQHDFLNELKGCSLLTDLDKKKIIEYFE